MQEYHTRISQYKAGIIAGTAILIMTIAAVVSTDLTIGTLVVDNDPEATFNGFRNNPLLFRTGIFSWIIVLICDLIIAWALYIYFRKVDHYLSLIAAWTRLIYTGLLGTAIAKLTHIGLMQSQQKLTGVIPEYFITETWLYYEGFHAIWSVGLLIFGFHIVLLGMLSFKSGSVPKWLAIPLILGGVGYILVYSLKLFLTDHDLVSILEWIFILPMLFEVILGIWLLIRSRKSIKVD